MEEIQVLAVLEPLMPRPAFGPPRNALGAFAWAVLQLPRAVWWTARESRLRSLLVAPALLAAVLTLLFCVAAVLGAGPLEALLFDRPEGVVGTATWLGLRVALTGCLLIAAVFTGWHLSAALTSASLERMALYVQREVQGDAPPPVTGAPQVLQKAVRNLFPRTRQLLVWALSTAAAMGLVLVPVVGPVLMLVAQTLINALFLAHGAITDNRERLGLPRRLLLREPALLLGYGLACVPVVLIPGVAAFAAAPVTVGGALVALGAHRRATEAPAVPLP
jgi:uncharacterized protein involved in cysteine biosynthesis